MWWLVIPGFTTLCYLDFTTNTTNTINQSNFKRDNGIVIHCDTGDLLIFFSFSIRQSSSIHWSVYEQQQRVVNVSETVVDIYNCKATHSLVYFDWTSFFKLCLFLTRAYAHVPFWSIDLCMSSSRRWECEWNCCWHLQLQGDSLTHVLWLNFFL